jgi:hydroxyacylglutathione hydrolase
MALVFERVLTEGLGDLSYFIGDDAQGIAAVIDPRADVDVYLELARRYKVAITHIFQTHIHEDFMSGALELAARAGSALNFMSHEGGGADYGYEHKKLRGGDTFEFGSVVLTARHTPGHTPEHISFLVAESKRPGTPYGVFSGGSLLINAAGRTDLLGPEQAGKLVAEQYHTLYDFYLGLDDHVLLHPTHAHGSPCGAQIGDRLSSSIGYERRFNPFLQARSLKEFHDFALGDLPPKPSYYPRLKETNTAGPEVLWNLPRVPALPAKAFKEALEEGKSVLVDTRMMLAFGGGHAPGAINIGARPELSVWAGWMLDAKVPLLLVLEDDENLEKVVRLFLRTGFTRFTGYLAGGMKAWDNSAFPLEEVRQVSVHELKKHAGDYQIVDVRAPDEWKKGHIPKAKHMFLPDLPEQLDSLSKDAPVAVYCDSGYRASLGASLLQKEGFSDVCNSPGSWQAWTKAGYPVKK